MIDEGIPDRIDPLVDDPLYLNKNIPVYMTAIAESFTSQYYRSLSIPSWERFGYTVTHMESVTEQEAKEQLVYRWFKVRKELFGTARRDFYLSEKITFINHHNLWQHVVNTNKPSIIIEHDCQLHHDIKKSVEDYNFRPFASSHVLDPRREMRKKRKSNPYFRLKPSVGYYITPMGALQLIRYLDQRTEITRDINQFLADMCKTNKWLERHQLWLRERTPQELSEYVFAHEIFDAEYGKIVKDGSIHYQRS